MHGHDRIQASAVHGDYVVGRDRLEGGDGLGDGLVGRGGEVEAADDGVDLVDATGCMAASVWIRMRAGAWL